MAIFSGPYQPCFLISMYSGSSKLGQMEPPRTHDKLSYDPCVCWNSLVRVSLAALVWGSSVGLNHSKLLRNTELLVVQSQWFPLELSSSRRFSHVERLQTLMIYQQEVSSSINFNYLSSWEIFQWSWRHQHRPSTSASQSQQKYANSWDIYYIHHLHYELGLG